MRWKADKMINVRKRFIFRPVEQSGGEPFSKRRQGLKSFACLHLQAAGHQARRKLWNDTNAHEISYRIRWKTRLWPAEKISRNFVESIWSATLDGPGCPAVAKQGGR